MMDEEESERGGEAHAKRTCARHEKEEGQEKCEQCRERDNRVKDGKRERETRW